MGEPNWVGFLDFLHEQDGFYLVEDDDEYESSGDYTSEHEQLLLQLQEELPFNLEDIERLHKLISQMENVGLIETTIKGSEWAEVSMEPEGFKVRHERELNSQRNRLNHLLAVLTAILAYSAVIQAAGAVLPVDGAFLDVLIGLSIVIGMALLVWFLDVLRWDRTWREWVRDILKGIFNLFP